ncbi:hypothetical protein IQ07DRAFT_9032 [Pyrenochaeta sp. DS3sAY3a]|nr:hypothetical protein IQ07DRAFT_9032 [Pyrenochaeta sp. DS3sAY3a]
MSISARSLERVFEPIIRRTTAKIATAPRACACVLSTYNKRSLASHISHTKPLSGGQNYTSFSTMGRKKGRGEYNDFLDGEKLRDNTEIRTSLQQSTSLTRKISPPTTRHDRTPSKNHKKGGPKKPPLTHFLCLPLVTPESKSSLEFNLETLKADLAKDNIAPPQAVRPVGTLHLTLGVMSLDADRLSTATAYLQSLDLYALLRDITQQVLATRAAEDGVIAENLHAAALPDTDALTIDLKALLSMQRPVETSVLYAEPVDGSGRLEAFAGKLREGFVKDGWVEEEGRALRLHATVLNTIYAKGGKRGGGKGKEKSVVKEAKAKAVHAQGHGESVREDASTAESGDEIQHEGSAHNQKPNQDHDQAFQAQGANGHGPKAKSWLRFDARNLIDQYKDCSWAEGVKIDRVQICKMGAKKIWSRGNAGEGEVVDEKYEVVAEKRIFE